MSRYICIHGHFYQPPRENPWLEAVELQDSAYPFHDWNERITEECYAPNTASRILDREGRIVDIINLYTRISFNFGPTLLSWLEIHRPEVYGAVIEADRRSTENFSGHGSAMAQTFDHMIMPLADRRDKITQTRWGIADFRRRFGRDPEGMWLPETAVDIASLEVLAAEGIAFTVLAPRQAARVREESSNDWVDVSGGRVDPKRPYECLLPSGRTIALFFYDGPVSQDVAFGGLLNNGEDFANRLTGTFAGNGDEPALVHIATDGETYGHHHRGGDMALAYCLHHIESSGSARLTNYGEFLELHPPTAVVEIDENSSWSCVHGVERWRKDCGCHTGAHPSWNQSWREALREAMDWLGERGGAFFARAGGKLFRDPWAARDAYIDVILDRDRANIRSFLRDHGAASLDDEKQRRALKLLEMQRNVQLSFTSCGWFFDDIGGIEARQVMMYAAQAMQYIEELGGGDLEEKFIAILAGGEGNREENGAVVYSEYVKPARVDHLRVGAHYSISSIFEEYPSKASIYCYTFEKHDEKRIETGRVKLVSGRVRTLADKTWEEKVLSYAALHLGDQNITAGVREFVGADQFEAMQAELTATLAKGDVMAAVRLIDSHFGEHTYSAWHLFRDEQRRVLGEVLSLTYENIEASYRRIYGNNHALMNFLQSMKVPLPHPLLVVAEYVLDRDLHNVVCNGPLDLVELDRIVGDVRRWDVKVDRLMLRFHANSRLNAMMEELRDNVQDLTIMKQVRGLILHLKGLDIELDLWQAQNIYFLIGKKLLPMMEARAADPVDASAGEWADLFRALGGELRVRLA